MPCPGAPAGLQGMFVQTGKHIPLLYDRGFDKWLDFSPISLTDILSVYSIKKNAVS